MPESSMIDLNERPFLHLYSSSQIFTWIVLVLQESTGLRCASRVWRFLSKQFGVSMATPTYQTGRLWVMRLGFYKLNRPKDKSHDWIWIIDHSIHAYFTLSASPFHKIPPTHFTEYRQAISRLLANHHGL